MSDNSGSIDNEALPRRELSLGDATSLIVGTVIAAGIYEATPTIAGSVPSAGWLLAVWCLGGIVTLAGALCYAELATAMPEAGGDYVFLSRAFGRPVGFLFAWAEMSVIRPGSIGLVAFVWARYANEVVPLAAAGVPTWVADHALVVYAAAAIFLLTLINVAGVRQGARMQNVLTLLKLGGLIVIFAACFLSTATPGEVDVLDGQLDLRKAMIFVILTFGGWSEMVYAAAEVKNPARNLTRALVLGASIITCVYLLANIAFLSVLGFAGVRGTTAVATDVVAEVFAGTPVVDFAPRCVGALICISCLGSINGQLFSAARVGFAFGREHPMMSPLGRWNARRGTPIVALLLQCSIASSVVIGFGVYQGNTSGFERMVDFTTPVFYIFLTLTGLSLFVFRATAATGPQPSTATFRVPGYPVVPLCFTAVSAGMLVSTLNYAWSVWGRESMWSIGLLAVGIVLAFVDYRWRRAS